MATHRCDAEYWVANLRHPVRFSPAVAAAGAAHTTFIEISPHPLLTYAISDTLGDTHHHALGTLARDTDDTVTFHTDLNTTHTTHPPTPSIRPNPTRSCPPRPGTTPATGSPPIRPPRWEHTRCWASASPIRPTASGSGKARCAPDLLWLGDHRVDDACVLPGAAYAELALAAATDAFGAD